MDDLINLKKDIRATIEALTETARRLKVSAKEAVNKTAEYEAKKNPYKTKLEAEGKADKTKALTVSGIEAKYRTRFAEERREAHLAKADHETDVLLFKGLQMKLSAQQTLARLIEAEMKMGEDF